MSFPSAYPTNSLMVSFHKHGCASALEMIFHCIRLAHVFFRYLAPLALTELTESVTKIERIILNSKKISQKLAKR